jgi:nicotinate (nicotinamide) nucleotide adenylyltransferase
MNKLQDNIAEVFKRNFGYTTLNERLADIDREVGEIKKYTSVLNLKEEAGDALCSIIQLCTESGWDYENVIEDALRKIESRRAQYTALGRKIKVALLGTAANPITRGHVQTAEQVLAKSGDIDEVWIMPACGHMYGKKMASAEHRTAMCELAVQHDRRIKIFDYEIRNKMAGETYNLFKRLKEEKELTEKYQFSFIIGMDNANTIHQWVNYADLLNLATFIVIPRRGIKRNPKVNWYLQKPHKYLPTVKVIECSSTEIRNLMQNVEANKETLCKKISPLVLNYIVANKLYTDQ